MKLKEAIVCPRCKSREWITIDRCRRIKVLRCLNCRRQYTVDFETRKIYRKDVFAEERKKFFRANCPECGSYNWRTTEEGEKEGTRNYLCVCGVWYTVNFKTKRVKRRKNEN